MKKRTDFPSAASPTTPVPAGSGTGLPPRKPWGWRVLCAVVVLVACGELVLLAKWVEAWLFHR